MSFQFLNLKFLQCDVSFIKLIKFRNSFNFVADYLYKNELTSGCFIQMYNTYNLRRFYEDQRNHNLRILIHLSSHFELE